MRLTRYHFGFIHLAVQMHIVLRHPELGMEQYVYNSNKKVCGRADLFNLDTGEVWELKTVRTGAAAAEVQAKRYCKRGNFLSRCKKALVKGRAFKDEKPYIEGDFPLACMGDYYQVFYFSTEPGVVLYRVIKTGEQTQPYAEYVPVRAKTKNRQTTIGGIPQYVTVRAGVGIGVCAFASFACYAFTRGGGHGLNLACAD